MKDLIKDLFKAGEVYGRDCESLDYWMKDYPNPDEALKKWLSVRLDKDLPCDRDIRKELIELKNSL